jgi:hypothetical protein
LTGNEGVRVPVVADSSAPSGTSPSLISKQTPAAIAATKAAAAQAAAKKAQQAAINIKAAALSFFGLDNQGVPTGFSVTDSKNVFGKARITKGYSTVNASGLVVANQFITGSVGPNVLIDQMITVDGSGTNYTANTVNVGFAGNWNSVEINSTESSIERLANGQFLVTATIYIGYLNPATFTIPTGNRGYDLGDAPKSITTRILLNSGKTQILAQAAQVLEK